MTREPVLPVAPRTRTVGCCSFMHRRYGAIGEPINAYYAQFTPCYARLVDVLHDYLVRAHASGAVFARSVARPPWGLTLPGSIQLSLHTMLRGHALVWLEDPAQAERLL